MLILRSCWSPWMFYDNTRQGSHAVAAYTVVWSIIAIVFLLYQIAGGESSQFYLPLFETDYGSTTTAVGLLLCLFFLLFGGMAILMSQGVKMELRYMVIPWLVLNALYTLFLFGFGTWLVYGYYSLLWSTMACIILYLKAGLQIYCHLCVYSQYQLIKLSQMPMIEVYYPQL